MSKITYYGKFQDGVGELCYDATLDGAAEEFGESDGFGWYGLVEGNFEKDDIRAALKDAGYNENILDYSEYRTLRTMAGAIVNCVNSGAVYVETFETEAALMGRWKALEAEYFEWLGPLCETCDMHEQDCYCEPDDEAHNA